MAARASYHHNHGCNHHSGWGASFLTVAGVTAQISNQSEMMRAYGWSASSISFLQAVTWTSCVIVTCTWPLRNSWGQPERASFTLGKTGSVTTDRVTTSWRQPVLSILCFIYINFPVMETWYRGRKTYGEPFISCDKWWPLKVGSSLKSPRQIFFFLLCGFKVMICCAFGCCSFWLMIWLRCQ